MQIELEEPFKNKWEKGSLVRNPENRYNVLLYNSAINKKITRTTISYARYLMSVKLGYEVPKEFEVDHIDDDKTNDNINNLQLLTQEENRHKEYLRYLREDQVYHTLICEQCKKKFVVTQRQLNIKIAAKSKNYFCTSDCGRKYNSKYLLKYAKSPISNKNIEWIKDLREQGFSSYRIAKITGFSGNTITKYW